MSLAKSTRLYMVLTLVAFMLCGCPPKPPETPVPPTADFEGALYVEGAEGESAALTASDAPVEGFDPMTVEFTDKSQAGSSPLTLWRWDFGDGETSEEEDPIHTYEDPGVYTVSLLVGSGSGNARESKVDYIVVTETILPEAAFTYSPSMGLAPIRVRFSDVSEPGTGEEISWLWDFGDGETSTQQNPSHTYEEVGVYTVSLTITTELGSDTETIEAAIDARAPLEASFTADPVLGYNTLTTTFTDTSSFGPATEIAWQWDFGDGATATLQHPVHTYIAPGVYSVSLTVLTEFGTSLYREVDLITVEETTVPVAEFSASPLKGVAPLTVIFTDLSTGGDKPITGYAWDFGDEGGSTEQSPIYQYENEGIYAVTLTVTTEDSEDTEPKDAYIEVVAPLEASFTADPEEGLQPLEVVFTDTSSLGVAGDVRYAWDFGDGQSSTEQDPTHSYADAGTYSVTLTLTTDVGVSSVTQSDLISVLEKTDPTAAFSADVLEGLAPLEVQFSDESSGGSADITAWAWDFGDGENSEDQNPTHTYTRSGRHTVTLTISTEHGADTVSRESYISVGIDQLTFGGEDIDIGNALVQTLDGGFAIAGSTKSFGAEDSDMYLARFDAQGNLLWEQTYGYWTDEYASDEEATALLLAPDGGFLLGGKTVGRNLVSDIYLVRTDSTGYEVWPNVIPTERDEFVNDMAWGPGSTILIAGATETEDHDFDMLFIKTDDKGNRMWRETYGDDNYDTATAVVSLGSDGFAFAGTTTTQDGSTRNMRLLRMDLDGTELWNYSYGLFVDNACESLALTGDGGFVLAGTTLSSNDGLDDAMVVRTDAEGVLQWSQSYGGSENDWATTVIEDSAGDVLLAGQTNSTQNGVLDMFLLKLDADGTALWPVTAEGEVEGEVEGEAPWQSWTYTYGGDKADMAADLIETAAGGYAMAGSTDSYGAGGSDMFFVHTNAEGIQSPLPLEEED